MISASARSSKKPSDVEICILSTGFNKEGELIAKLENAKKFHPDFTNKMEISVGKVKIKQNKNGKTVRYCDNGAVYSKDSDGKIYKKEEVSEINTRD